MSFVVSQLGAEKFVCPLQTNDWAKAQNLDADHVYFFVAIYHSSEIKINLCFAKQISLSNLWAN